MIAPSRFSIGIRRAGGRLRLEYPPSDRPERPNVVCRWDTGRPGPTLVLNGHLDTKPPLPREDWSSDPYAPEVRDGRLYGLGAADMKGAVAALVYGLHAAQVVSRKDGRKAPCTDVREVLHAEGNGAPRMGGSVLLALTADEEGEA